MINENNLWSPFESWDELNINFLATKSPIHQKFDQHFSSTLKFNELNLDSVIDFSMKEQELIEEGLPRLEIADDIEHDAHANQDTHEISQISSIRNYRLINKNDEVCEEEIDTTRRDKK